MTIQSFSLSPGRINRFKGRILKAAEPRECLSRGGRQVRFDKNSSDTYVARRWVPYGATTSNPNVFFSNGTGDRAAAMVQANQTQEGVTSLPESIVPMDVTVVMQQFNCLYGFTDKTFNLYEDDVPQAMVDQIGTRVTLIKEMVNYGALKASTNQFYGGTGTSRTTVNGKITLPLLRRIAKSLMANHAIEVTKVLKASPDYGTDAVSGGFIVYLSTDLESDVRDLPNFVPSEKYASGKPMANEIGKCERFRFVTSPDLIGYQDAATSVTASTYSLASTTGTNPDVYPFIVVADEAWSQVAVRGMDSLDPTWLPPGMKDKSDPQGQRGYAGTKWWQATMVENNGWMAVGNVATSNLVG